MNSKIKSLRNIVSIVFLLFAITSKAQTTNKSENSNSIKGQQEPLKSQEIKQHTVGEKTVIQRSTPVVKQGTAVYLNEDDVYQGRSEEILSNLIITSIPSDFPKYENGKGVKWYNQQIDNYYRLHPSILKESVRKKLGV